MTTSPEPFIPGADTAEDLCERARSLLAPKLFAHVLGGAGDERTMAANQAGFGRYRLLQRVLVDVTNVDTSVELLGSRLAAPIFTAPTGGILGVHPDGEKAIARAAASTGIGFILNAFPSVTTEEVALEAGPERWQQLYWQGDREVMADLAYRAQDAGYKAIVLTVDTGVRTTRPRTIREQYREPDELRISPNVLRYTDPNWERRPLLQERVATVKDDGDFIQTWKHVEWLRSAIDVPFVLKGVMSPPDAVRAIEIGAEAVIVSNHGGRSLDGLPGTIEVLEEIVQAVGGRAPVLVDGGIRRATDIVIALALGATAVALGRPIVWALACGGEEVVTAYLADLIDDFGRTLQLLGVASLAGLRREHVSSRDRYVTDAELAPYLPPR